MKKIIDIIVQIMIVMMFVMTIFLPKKSFSQNENRYLQQLPLVTIENILSGKFMTAMTDYVADHFPLREELLNVKTNIFKILGVIRQNNVYYASDNYLIEEYQKPLNNEKIVRVVNRFINNNSFVHYDFMLVPTSSYILKNKLPLYNLNYDEEETLNYFKNNIQANYIDVTNSLLSNNDKDIYYRTDHHWTSYGAYYAYLEYCNKKNLLPNNYSFVTVSNDFYGTLYSKVLDKTIKPDTIMKAIDNNSYMVEYPSNITSSLYNDSYLQEKDQYSYFLNSNQSLIIITNNNVSDKELLVIKDSYANSFIPLIASHYSKIHVIDPRYYKKKISTYMEENNIYNVLFLYNVGTLDNDLGILSIN